MKVQERNEARRLRRDEGLSLKEIALQLGVAKSSVSHWVRDIELTPRS
jgi:transcriptional regulator with XRE-family HTH domain